MNSFYRMLAHHVAGYYQLGHFVDPLTKCLVLQKNSQSACPVLRLFDLVEPVEQMQILLGTPMPSQPSMEQTSVGEVKIMRRKTSPEANHPEGDSIAANTLRANKSHDQREAEYAAARERIFQDFKPSSGDESEHVTTTTQPQSKGMEGGRTEVLGTSFNVDAEPFVPSNAPQSSLPGHTASPPLPAYSRRIINIIDPSAGACS